MHTLEPLLLNAWGIDGRAAARAAKEEAIICAFMMSARSPHLCTAASTAMSCGDEVRILIGLSYSFDDPPV